jgi:hypothetical protein
MGTFIDLRFAADVVTVMYGTGRECTLAQSRPPVRSQLVGISSTGYQVFWESIIDCGVSLSESSRACARGEFHQRVNAVQIQLVTNVSAVGLDCMVTNLQQHIHRSPLSIRTVNLFDHIGMSAAQNVRRRESALTLWMKLDRPL